MSGSSCVPWNIGAVGPLRAGWPLKTCIVRGLGIQKNYLVLQFWSDSLEPFLQFLFLNPNYDVINDVIPGFAKVVERCGFHHWIAQRISWGEVVSVFLYLL